MKTLRAKYFHIIMTALFLVISGIAYAQNPVTVSFNKGVEYASQGEFGKARDEFEKSLKIDPFYGPAKYRLKIIKGVIEQKIGAEAAIYLFMGVSYSSNGQVDLSIKNYTSALKIDPGFAVAYADRGDAYHQNGQLDQAISDYTKAIEINPKDAVSYLNRGNVNRNKGQHEKAVMDYTTAIGINPGFAVPYVNRGNAYSAIGQVAQAIKDYTEAIEINPKFSSAYYNRGKVYSDNGEFDKAVSDYTKAIGINPNDTQAYLNRGLVNFVKLGNKVKGCADWKKACDLGRCGNYSKAKQQGDCSLGNSSVSVSPLSDLAGKWGFTEFVVGGNNPMSDLPMSAFKCGEVMAVASKDQTVSFSTTCDKMGEYSFRLTKLTSEAHAYLISVNSKVGISIDGFPVTYVDGKGWHGEHEQLVNGEAVSLTAMVQRIEGKNWYGWTVQVFPTSVLSLSLDEIKEPYFKVDLTRRK